MSDKLNFSVPKTKAKQPFIFPVMVVLQVVILAIILTALTVNLVMPAGTGYLPADAQKELAMKLQKQGLAESAVQAWKDYLAVARVSANERAATWYTIGKIYQEAGLYEQALDSFYRSESVFKREDLKDDLSRRIQDSLEMAGRFAALRYELSDRVGLQEKDAGDEVLAEIGTEKITKADIDKRIDEQVDFVISRYAAYMDKDALTKQREELFKYYSGADGQQRMLTQYIQEELLYRKAREEKLAEDAGTRALLRDQERKVLAEQLLTKKKSDLVNITENDLKAYYEAQKGDYIKAGRQQGFDEVKNDLYAKLIEQKEQEVMQKIVDELMKQYNVVIHTSRLKQDTTGQK